MAKKPKILNVDQELRIAESKNLVLESLLKTHADKIVLSNVIDPASAWELNRFFAIYHDMSDCINFLAEHEKLIADNPHLNDQSFVDDKKNRILVTHLHAFFTSIIIYYCRAFTYSVSDLAPQILSDDHIPDKLKKVHKKLMELRHSYVAHKDPISEFEVSQILLLLDPKTNFIHPVIGSRRNIRFDAHELPAIKELIDHNKSFALNNIMRVKHEIKLSLGKKKGTQLG